MTAAHPDPARRDARLSRPRQRRQAGDLHRRGAQSTIPASPAGRATSSWPAWRGSIQAAPRYPKRRLPRPGIRFASRAATHFSRGSLPSR
ncbi:MAG: hypothetical protein MZW92_64750 [Comamonadaceae bacterium]|nr:hypothetical protein [Comamonadaceae bacterium]